METKRCTQCYELKPLEAFYKDASKPDGRTSACKPCRSRQVSATYRRRVQRSRGQVVEESPRLLEHNVKTLENLLGEREPENMTLRTKHVEAIKSDPKGIVIQDKWALIETRSGKVSKDLTKCSILSLARFLELNQIKIIAREDLNA